jgi:ABC-type Na+ efflux pump permease subunit
MNLETIFLLLAFVVANTLLAFILWVGLFTNESMEFDSEFWWIKAIWIPPFGIIASVFFITILIPFIIIKIILEKITFKQQEQ